MVSPCFEKTTFINIDTDIDINICTERSLGGGGSLTSAMPLQMIDEV